MIEQFDIYRSYDSYIMYNGSISCFHQLFEWSVLFDWSGFVMISSRELCLIVNHQQVQCWIMKFISYDIWHCIVNMNVLHWLIDGLIHWLIVWIMLDEMNFKMRISQSSNELFSSNKLATWSKFDEEFDKPKFTSNRTRFVRQNKMFLSRNVISKEVTQSNSKQKWSARMIGEKNQISILWFDSCSNTVDGSFQRWYGVGQR